MEIQRLITTLQTYREQTQPQMSLRDLSRRIGITPKNCAQTLSNGAGLNKIERRRQWCQVLSIPPGEMGLDAHFLDSQSRGWWLAEGDPIWTSGLDGYPRPGDVVRSYRTRKQWTQSDLAQAMNISEGTILQIERNTLALSIPRRTALILILGIPASLLGLLIAEDPPIRSFHVPISTPSVLDDLQCEQNTLWSNIYTASDRQTVLREKEIIQQLHTLQYQVSARDLPRLLSMKSIGYQHIAHIGRPFATGEKLLPFANRAIYLAREVYARNPRSVDWLAVALLRRMDVLHIHGYHDRAMVDAEEILSLLKHTDVALSSSLKMGLARMYAPHAINRQDQKKVRILIEESETTLAAQSPDNPYHLLIDPSIHMLRYAQTMHALVTGPDEFPQRMSALHSMQQKLQDQQQRLDPAYFHVRICLLLVQAQTELALKEYDAGAQYACDILDLFHQSSYLIHAATLMQITQTLNASSFRDHPLAHRLRWEMREIQRTRPEFSL